MLVPMKSFVTNADIWPSWSAKKEPNSVPERHSLKQTKIATSCGNVCIYKPCASEAECSLRKVDTVQVLLEQMSHLYFGMESEVYFRSDRLIIASFNVKTVLSYALFIVMLLLSHDVQSQHRYCRFLVIFLLYHLVFRLQRSYH